MTLIDILTDNQKEQLYFDYLRHEISMETYAKFHKIEVSMAQQLIEEGRTVNHNKNRE